MSAARNPEPNLLQHSFGLLFNSPHLGVAIANEERVVDANDAFLALIGYTRDDMRDGRIDWWAMTPAEYRALDVNGMQQLREYGACMPFEKEYVLHDGSRLPFMVGAIRLSTQPLTWVAYVISLSEQRKLAAAEQQARDLQAKTQLVNQLAHELNNPLAALTFMLHLLSTRSDIATAESKQLVADMVEQLQRITATVQKVLTASGNSGSQRRPSPT